MELCSYWDRHPFHQNSVELGLGIIAHMVHGIGGGKGSKKLYDFMAYSPMEKRRVDAIDDLNETFGTAVVYGRKDAVK